MRESGFDVSFRFGPFGAGTIDYAPVGLNSLLFKAEANLEEISRELGKPEDASEWHERSRERALKMNRYLWNRQRGLFFDYDFKTRRQSDYVFATTFYPLWAGLATPEEARAVEHNLKLFERPGGLVTSTRRTGAQWDYPYGWAPLQLVAVEGLRRYGYDEDANRLSREFPSMVPDNFRRDGTIREKYNVVTRSSETHIQVGYTANVIGFGWTNGVFVTLRDELRDKSP
jgi:alpha,alpha-trehalase